jgi:phosphatidylglycerol:prolipoprotein diacylglycerol transferase
MGNAWLPVLASLVDWGWLRIGPPYIYINIDPVIVHLGPLALHWYGLMYVVAILVGLWGVQGYIRRKGLSEEVVYRVLWWCIVAGLVGGRLYFVIQQPDLVQGYLLRPWRILATWEGGMAFYGAIFLVVPVLFWRARVERVNPLVALDAAVLFAAIGQIFGRVGNLINGDIIGYPSTLPWSTVYVNPASFACQQGLCNVPVQPAAAYEMLCNFALLAILLVLSRRLRRPGLLLLTYLYGYAITQFVVFFWRANLVVSFLGLNWGLKQAQWTSLVVFLALLPLSYLVLRSRYARPVPVGEPAATYGIPQEPKVRSVLIEQPLHEEEEASQGATTASPAAMPPAGEPRDDHELVTHDEPAVAAQSAAPSPPAPPPATGGTAEAEIAEVGAEAGTAGESAQEAR